MTIPRRNWPQLGAIPRADGLTDFRVWAPAAASVAVRIQDREFELHETEEGLFEAGIEVAASSDYRFVLDQSEFLADPCSRWQPDGLRGPSRVLDLRRRRGTWTGLSLDDLVIYELQVGTFSRAGTFAGVADRLSELRSLGVTAIEVMPIGTFPGERNWGYDGVYTSAPHRAYGGPEGFARLVAAAHQEGLGVILDVVYNHIGPGAEAITAYGPYFTDRGSTLWGETLDYGQRGVREWAIQNAELWVRDYGVDGLRLDATHAIHDDSEPHLLVELAQRVRAINPAALLIAEMETGDLRPIEEWNLDAQWADEFHHALHVLLTREREGYYRDYQPSVAALSQQISRAPAQRLVFCSQNHDQVGNRALGDRPRPAELPIRAAALLLAPQIPLLFMGEEYGEQQPFQFFTDHDDPAIAEATRAGRKREFSRFAAFSDEDVPDPQSPATFARSQLRPDLGDRRLVDLYTRLIALRRQPVTGIEADERHGLLRVRRGDCEAVLNFSDSEHDGVAPLGVSLATV